MVFVGSGLVSHCSEFVDLSPDLCTFVSCGALRLIGWGFYHPSYRPTIQYVYFFNYYFDVKGFH